LKAPIRNYSEDSTKSPQQLKQDEKEQYISLMVFQSNRFTFDGFEFADFATVDRGGIYVQNFLMLFYPQITAF
jgi:hypothetical protein